MSESGKSAGTYKITALIDELKNTNYNITLEEGTYTIDSAKDDEKEIQSNSNPKTGDYIAIWVELFAISLFVILVTSRIKNKMNNRVG